MAARWILRLLGLMLLLGPVLLGPVPPARADALFESGRLLGTAGVTEIEGGAGGGLAASALISGYGTRDAVGASIDGTFISLPNFTLGAGGAAVGLYDRVELSYQRLVFDTGATGAALGLGRGFTLREDVVGAKVRLFGDAVYAQDSLLPQVAAGMQVKVASHDELLHALGADAAGVDLYVAATKLLLAPGVLLNGAVRVTRANQFGLLGFGGPKGEGYHPEVELSAIKLLPYHLAAGAEFRTKPDNLSFAREGHAWDAFVAWFVNKNLSLTLAYLDLGSIATRKNQDGVYLGAQVGF